MAIKQDGLSLSNGEDDTCIVWNNGPTSWKGVLSSSTAEDATASGIEMGPTFMRWGPYVMNERKHKRKQKFGFELPKPMAEAYALVRHNNNTVWTDVIAKRLAK